MRTLSIIIALLACVLIAGSLDARQGVPFTSTERERIKALQAILGMSPADCDGIVGDRTISAARVLRWKSQAGLTEGPATPSQPTPAQK